MEIENVMRRLRGAFGNALVWGVGWFTAGLVLFTTLSVIGVLSFSWAGVFEWAIRAGIIGTVTGGAFSIFVGLLYHGKRLSDLSWVRFGIGGGIVTGLFVPLFLQTMNLLSGSGLVPWELVLDDAVLTAFLGGAVAGGSLKLAQLAEALPPGKSQDQIDLPDDVDRLGAP